MSLPADLNEIVFHGRHKEYGAYDLRRYYSRSLMTAFLLSSSVFAAGIITPWVAKKFWPEGETQETQEFTISETELGDPPPIDENEPPPPPEVKPPPPPEIAQVKYVPPKVVKDEEAPEEEEPLPDMEDLEKADTAQVGFENIEGEAMPQAFDEVAKPKEVAPEPEPEPVEEPDPFEFFEGQQPEPVNMGEVRNLIGYPEVAREAGIQGVVIARILVDKTGKYKKHMVLNKEQAHPVLVSAVEKKVNLIRFTPGRQAGHPVPVWVNIPFKFTLSN